MLRELVQSGALKAGTKLFANYHSRVIEAELHADGQIAVNGKRYATASAAGAHAKAFVAGKPVATDGWQFWQYRDGNGELVPLDNARQAFLKLKG